ncbi:MAG: dipeptide/oligopeptide/nickel ABC transporter ATP-binding protein [Alphaproteobacteria bacterium]|nr:dipeptide/oligopeptide/nickel ABC transporter ATP-binding protein [Alphaproteobacteria bacterium]
MSGALLEARDIAVAFGEGAHRRVNVLDCASISVHRGECVGLVGHSGSGKSTLARILVGLQAPLRGEVRWRGSPIRPGDKSLGRELQFVFQNPTAALNPRMANWELVSEAAALLTDVRDRRGRMFLAKAMFRQVALPADALRRYPHALSVGQRQRLALARALAVRPQALILDEPTASLDLSVQAQILDQLLAFNLAGGTIVLVSHDEAVVRHLCTRVLKLNNQRIEEA